ncbi:class I SAM-dependent methyltransferase [Sphingobacterium thalpophilum]|uniref:class I SAM-dependent methyltransferase n=1 Tax=Sphingobacterium thalpophilum TaxID=259 RepID=UPI0024A69842|nr:class I SAM-dependent methyltransferase [Sphingobacterium thalpophilum]
MMENTNRNNEPFHNESYNRHSNWYTNRFPEKEQKVALLQGIKTSKGTINHWLQNQFFNCVKPITAYKSASWLTVGDAYGHDANYLIENGVLNVIATDINDAFLAVSKEVGLIENYSAENAENLSFEDNSIDYILCKETYHHFPRPYAALYEMVRVAKKGIVIIEPQDPILKMPFLLFMNNVLEKIKYGLVNKIWKNRFSYEPVGNFVYKVSEREMEKFAAGLNLPMVAIKSFNPNFWFQGSDKIPAIRADRRFRQILLKKGFRDVLSKYGIVPSQSLSVIIFKSIPEIELQNVLQKEGYRLIKIPDNPHL